MDMRKLAKDDPLHRNAEKDPGGGDMSPMEPPEAYEPPAKETVPYEDLHPFLKRLVDDHRRIVELFTALEAMLQQIDAAGTITDQGPALASAFASLERELAAHHRLEERRLFPLLHERLIAAGEHSSAQNKRTGVDVLEDDHVQAMQQVAAASAVMVVSTRLPERRSARVALSVGIREGKELIEHLRLHLFREDNIVFGLAQKYLTTAELDAIAHGHR